DRGPVRRHPPGEGAGIVIRDRDGQERVARRDLLRGVEIGDERIARRVGPCEIPVPQELDVMAAIDVRDAEPSMEEIRVKAGLLEIREDEVDVAPLDLFRGRSIERRTEREVTGAGVVDGS